MNRRSCCTSIIVALALAGTLVTAVGAQSPRYQVELVTGSCAEPGGPVALLGEPSEGSDLAGAPVEMEAVAAALGSVVRRTRSALPMTLPDIAASGHAVRVFERYRPPRRLVACGEFGAIDEEVGEIQLGLAGIGDSGLHGVAWLRDNGNGTTSASVAIASSPATAPTAGADGRIEVAIRNSLYLPDPLEVEAGTTVTWVNEDALPHTTTATDGAFDSGYMALDDRYSHTFEAPGEYPVFCVFHPRMRAVVIVS